MSTFFKANTNKDAVKDGGSGGQYITKSGVYPITIKHVSVAQNDKGARSLNFNVDFNGTPHTFYGLTLDNNDGTPNYQAAVFNKLLIIAGIEEVAEPEIITVKLGAEGKPTELNVLSEFDDLECKICVNYEYSLYNGEVREKKVIKAFYTPEGLTAAEVIAGATEPKQIFKDEEYFSKATLKDDITEQMVADFKESKKSGSTPAAKAPVAKKPTVNPFAKK